MAGKNIRGITIEIGGDATELSKALQAPEKDIANLQKELREIERGLKIDPGNLELLGQKSEVVASQISAVSDKLKILQDSQAEVKRQFEQGEIGADQYRAFQREIITTEEKLKSLEETAKNIPSAFEAAAQKAGQSMQDLGGKIEGAGKALAPFSAAAGGAVVGLFGLAAKAGAAADDLNTLSAQTGLSTEELQKFQYASDIIDVSMDTLTGSMAKLTKNMATAQKGTGDAAKAFDELGIRITDSNGQLRSNQDVFNETIAALGRMENETQRDAYAMQIFGRSAQDLNPLILGGADALKELGDEAAEMGLILSQDALDAANEFNDEIDKLKAQSAGTFAALGTEIGTALLPMLQSLADMARGLMEWIRGLDDGTIRFITTILLLVAGIAPVLIVVGKVITAVGTIMTIIPKLQGAMAGLNAVLAANPVILIVAAVVALVAAFIYLWNTSDDFRNFWIGLWEKITGVVGKAVDGIKKFFTETIPDLVKSIGEWFKELPETLKNIGIDMITGLWEGIKETFGKVKDKITGLFKDIVGSIKDTLGIHSPSRVFAGIGGNMAEGLSVGWDNEIGKVQRELNASVEGIGRSVQTTTNNSYDNSTHTAEVMQPINVTIDARNVQDFNTVIDYFSNYRRRSRSRGNGVDNGGISTNGLLDGGPFR